MAASKLHVGLTSEVELAAHLQTDFTGISGISGLVIG
jgi:hypothetical protein